MNTHGKMNGIPLKIEAAGVEESFEGRDNNRINLVCSLWLRNRGLAVRFNPEFGRRKKRTDGADLAVLEGGINR
jgi:hypothetical protein